MDALHADHGHKETQESCNPALQGIFRRRQIATDHDTEDGEPEELKGFEIESEVANDWSKRQNFAELLEITVP